jgi:hypothetical protein
VRLSLLRFHHRTSIRRATVPQDSAENEDLHLAAISSLFSYLPPIFKNCTFSYVNVSSPLWKQIACDGNIISIAAVDLDVV